MINIEKNNLSNNPSPYLQQHKNNPVNWQIWSNDILEIAKKEFKTYLIKYWICQLSLVSCNGA